MVVMLRLCCRARGHGLCRLVWLWSNAWHKQTKHMLHAGTVLDEHFQHVVHLGLNVLNGAFHFNNSRSKTNFGFIYVFRFRAHFAQNHIEPVTRQRTRCIKARTTNSLPRLKILHPCKKIYMAGRVLLYHILYVVRLESFFKLSPCHKVLDLSYQ